MIDVTISQRKRFTTLVLVLVLAPILMMGYQNCTAGFKPLEQIGNLPSSSTGTNKAAEFTCTDPSARALRPSLILSKKQYENTLSDLFGAPILQVVASDLATLLDDTYDKDSHTRTSQLTPQQVEAYFRIANAVAADVTGNRTAREAIFGTCSSAAVPTSTCIDGYLNGFARRILRRPLSAEEVTTAQQIANATGDYITNLKAVLALHLQSPTFLWRFELGSTTQQNMSELTLTPFEVASRISYEAADTTPDPTLLQAAERDELQTLAQVQAQTRRLLQTPNGRDKIRRNIMRWAMAEYVADIDSLPAALKSGLNMTNLGDAMTTEMKSFIDYVVFTKNGSYLDLITSKVSFASHSGLADIYGHAPVIGGAPATVGGRRQGILMRSPFLTGPSARTLIIHRGVEFQKRILCNTIPSPTADIVDLRTQETFTHAELLGKTNREAIEYQTKNAVCMGCHSVINPTGFALENLDPFGRLRVSEAIFDDTGAYHQSLPVSTQARVPVAPGDYRTVADAADLITNVATSSRASACFSRNIYRYVYERTESPEDDCTLAKVHDIVSDPAKPLLDALVELIANDATFVKKMN